MKHLLTILALAATTGAYAQSISSDDARQRAAQFFTAKSAAAGPHRTPAKIDPVLAYTAQTSSTPAFYVFNRAADTDGFVIINARDDAEQPILGYSESSSFNPNNLPDNFRWWLQQYEQNGVCKAPAKANASRHNIDPIVKTKWDQGNPYNRLIPHANFSSFVTGCTATAMAQIMKTHEWPKSGKGSHSYRITYNGTTPINFSADFASTTYDWANMIDDYTHGFNDAQANAVATLMYHAGVAEEALYGTSTSAEDRHSAQALINYFDYDASMLRAERAFFSDDEWDNIIYSELAEGRAIMYSGQTGYDKTDVGHAFVCDGYNATDQTYHINWGWSGNYDGYFLLTGPNALRPAGTGTGGGAAGSSYSYSQAINYNIRPNEGGEYVYQVAVQDEFRIGYEKLVTDKVTSTTIDRSERKADKMLYYRVAPYNYGFTNINIKYGIVMRNKSTGETYGSSEFSAQITPSRWTENWFTVSQTDNSILRYPGFSTSIAKKDGIYEVLPAFSADNGATWQIMKYAPGTTIPEITITGTPDVDPDAIELTEELCFKEWPTVGQDNIVYSPADLSLTAPLINRSAETVSAFTVLIDCDNGPYAVTYGFGNLPSGYFTTPVFNDLSLRGQLHFTPGHVYTYQFFLDQECQQPMNIPELSFYYSSTSTPTTQEVAKLIELAKQGHGNTILVHSLVNKILGK